MDISLTIYSVAVICIAAGAIMIMSGQSQIRLLNARRWRMQVSQISLYKYPPVSWVRSILDKRHKERIDMEVYEAISFLRNITAIERGNTTSTDSVIQQLASHKGTLSPIYGHMLRLLRQNQMEKATQYFAEATGTEIGKDFGRLLIQWEEIDPKNLIETLLSHQKNIKEIRLTVQKRRDELISDIIYMPVVINIMLIFINFIYVGYFLDQKEMLKFFTVVI